ncbi:inner centromere protein isoform X1 [Bufo gargarizans]|uniref:inner centromere protein isoform X1 n=1 Tax=Bufo gargarizans TaxID=30331 RepID=UPI001CF0EED1|nr:inner centromere protein isoform X1 [Bufo gargarizans]
MNDPESLSQLLQVYARKTEDFFRLLDSKHMVWLQEIEDAARKMFSSDFTAEPELMPKTPSQKRRRKKRTSIVPENRDPSGRRISRRKSSVSWTTSVRRLSSRNIAKPLDTSIKDETEQQPKKMTRSKAQASITCMPVAEKPLEDTLMPTDRVLQVKISSEERRSAEVQLSEVIKSVSMEKNPLLETVVPTSSAPPIPPAPPAVSTDEPSAPVTPEKNSRTAAKLKIADSSTPKVQAGSIDLTLDSPPPIAQDAKQLALELSNYSVTPTGSKSDRRSVRRSIVGRKSTSCRASLANQYSLANKRESMTKEAVRKSIRRSVSRKKTSEISTSSSYKSYQSSVEIVDDEITVKIKPETAQPVEEAPEDHKRSLRTRAFNKIAISKQADSEPQQMTAETVSDTDDQTISRRKSYKRAMDDLSDGDQSINEQVNSPPRKKTPSPPCPPSKVIKPPPHMRTFLHTVQKNQLLMTPGSIGKCLIAKSFIKRNTPLKVDPKTDEKERQRLETLRKKEAAEVLRKQKIEEGKKRKQEELKLRREERQRKVLQARERVEQLEEEKKKKMEQKLAQIDEKSEKVREDRLAEEKAKKKMTVKKQEEVENRRRQEEEARKLKAKQLEEELLQKKREEEEQERQRMLAEAKKMELERERQLAAEKERERLERERALQLQRELEQQRKEAEERKRKEQQERLEQERQERLRKEMEAQKRKELEEQRLREEQERIAKEKQAAVGAQTLNVTMDIQNSPACESYEMTPKGYKAPSMKINEDDYGMDLNSDDSTDDESKPRKPIPAWASGNQLSQAMCRQYYHPIDVDKFYGIIDSPKLEDLFYKSKPRYNKRTSSAVWHSPPLNSNRQHLAVGYGMKKY